MKFRFKYLNKIIHYIFIYLLCIWQLKEEIQKLSDFYYQKIILMLIYAMFPLKSFLYNFKINY